MMTCEMMVEVLEGLGADVCYDFEDGEFDVMVEDFDGFDEDWAEIIRELDNPVAVARFEKMLEKECLSRENDWVLIYHFEGFDVQLTYASSDI